MSLKLKPFNPVAMLQDDEIADYLTEAYLDEDPQVFIIALGDVVKHKGVAEMARQTGLNRESLYKTFNGKVQPKWDTVHRLLKALGVKLTVAA
ncbi:addiction module antidote protein [Endozoicomonas sp. GU-1]|uniref:addiction module antidote protein n=1 Tax=Endozoicomonas sp. GU-1 TaxID=3009078 RepID=UPI0022B366C4|nr:addiction module antidote protein [Endozoicomonas sp. GU-1]WBA80932.1 putative addiction module antidote protein [Endozoicomonas sp. GU-1]WBA88499.1 putative addiction module antidote protein [Endozoicomonas sp. GU-1]